MPETFRTYESVWRHFKKAFKEKAEEIHAALSCDSFITGVRMYVNDWQVSQPEDFYEEDYSFWITVKTDDDSFDIRLELSDSLTYDGEDENGKWQGVNVSLMITTHDGEIIGSYSPYNYTPEVWTHEYEEIDNRLRYLDAEEIALLIYKHVV